MRVKVAHSRARACVEGCDDQPVRAIHAGALRSTLSSALSPAAQAHYPLRRRTARARLEWHTIATVEQRVIGISADNGGLG